MADGREPCRLGGTVTARVRGQELCTNKHGQRVCLSSSFVVVVVVVRFLRCDYK